GASRSEWVAPEAPQYGLRQAPGLARCARVVTPTLHARHGLAGVEEHVAADEPVEHPDGGRHPDCVTDDQADENDRENREDDRPDDPPQQREPEGSNQPAI